MPHVQMRVDLRSLVADSFMLTGLGNVEALQPAERPHQLMPSEAESPWEGICRLSCQPPAGFGMVRINTLSNLTPHSPSRPERTDGPWRGHAAACLPKGVTVTPACSETDFYALC